jgi:hypothetical protein
MEVKIKKGDLKLALLTIKSFQIKDGKIVSESGLLHENLKASVKHRLQKIHKQLAEEYSKVEETLSTLKDEKEKEEFLNDESTFNWEGCKLEMVLDFQSENVYDFDFIEEKFCDKSIEEPK